MNEQLSYICIYVKIFADVMYDIYVLTLRISSLQIWRIKTTNRGGVL